MIWCSDEWWWLMTTTMKWLTVGCHWHRGLVGFECGFLQYRKYALIWNNNESWTMRASWIWLFLVLQNYSWIGVFQRGSWFSDIWEPLKTLISLVSLILHMWRHAVCNKCRRRGRLSFTCRWTRSCWWRACILAEGMAAGKGTPSWAHVCLFIRCNQHSSWCFREIH